MPLNPLVNEKFLNILVLADKSPGHANQAIGVAEALGKPFKIWHLKYNWLAKLPNKLLGATKYSVQRPPEEIALFCPDIVISCGRRTAPIARYFRKKYGNRVALIHILNPDAGHGDFKIIVTPMHDNTSSRDNTFHILTAPHRLNAQILDEAKTAWRHIVPANSQTLGVLIGGGIKGKQYSNHEMLTLANSLADCAIKNNIFLFITTSRRTGSDNFKCLQNILQNKLPKEQFYLHCFDSGTANPYYGIIALSDYLLITGDSVSMVSEALFTSKPVYIYDNLSCLTAKHRIFIKSLYEAGAAKEYNGLLTRFERSSINSSQEIANFIADIY